MIGICYLHKLDDVYKIWWRSVKPGKSRKAGRTDTQTFILIGWFQIEFFISYKPFYPNACNLKDTLITPISSVSYMEIGLHCSVNKVIIMIIVIEAIDIKTLS